MRNSQAIVVQSSREKEYQEGKALRIRGDSGFLSLRTLNLHRDGPSRSQKTPDSLKRLAHRWYLRRDAMSKSSSLFPTVLHSLKRLEHAFGKGKVVL